MLSLRELQSGFFDALAAAVAEPDTPLDGDAAPLDPALRQAVRGDSTLSAEQRLQIYADMYRARLLDVLREDFPRTLAVVGDDAFVTLGCAYLARCPSRHPSIRHAGDRFVGFLDTQAVVPPFLSDLARLEWARVEVFDAADVVPLALADLQSVPAEAWPALTFEPIDACIVVESRWPVHRIWAEAETGASIRSEDANTSVRVWREHWSVSHAAMGVVEQRAFRALQRGAPFAELCAVVASELDESRAVREMGAILLRWIEDGVLARGDSCGPVRALARDEPA
jgi:hypothetical protein